MASFYEAVEAGNLDEINEIAAKEGFLVGSESTINFLSDKVLPGWNENSYNGSGAGNSALHLALWLGSTRAIIDRLLELGADIHLKSKGNGFAPLHCAVYSGKIELVALLLDRGCNPNEVEDCSGFSAIFWASFHAYQDIANLLLDCGADIHQKANEEWTVLNYAASEGSFEMVQMLLNRGANVHEKDDAGWSAIHWICQEGYIKILDILIEGGANIHEPVSDGRNALLLACQEGHEHLVTSLLDHGASIHFNNDRSNSLHYSITNGHKKVVDLLLARGCNIYEKTANEGWTARSGAKHRNYTNIVETIDWWPVTMWIVLLQDLMVYHLLDALCTHDLLLYIGSEADFL